MAGYMYNIGVKFNGKNNVSPALKAIKKDSKNAGSAALKMSRDMNNAFRAIQPPRIVGLLGGAGMGYGLTRMVKGVVTASGRFDVANIQFTKLIGNAQEARSTLDKLVDFAAKTPFEFIQSLEMSKGLLAANVTAKQLVPTMRKLGDLGMGDPEKMEQLAHAYSKVRMTGKATWRELQMFATAGVPIFDEIRKLSGATGQGGLESFVRRGKVKFPILEQAINNLAGPTGKFNGMMMRMMDTIPGLMSNMVDSFFKVKVAIGDAMELPLKTVLVLLSALAGRFHEWLTVSGGAEAITQRLNNAVIRLANMLIWAKDNFSGFVDIAKRAVKVLSILSFVLVSLAAATPILWALTGAMKLYGWAAAAAGRGTLAAFWPVLAVLAAVALAAFGVYQLLKWIGLVGDKKITIGTNYADLFREVNGVDAGGETGPRSLEGASSVMRSEESTTSVQEQRIQLGLTDDRLQVEQEGTTPSIFGGLNLGTQTIGGM